MPVRLPQRGVRLRVLGIESKRTIEGGDCVIDILGLVILEQISPTAQVLLVSRRVAGSMSCQYYTIVALYLEA